MSEEKIDQQSPFGATHRGLSIATHPSIDLPEVNKTGWAYSPDALAVEVSKKVAVAQELLMSMSIITKEERGALAAEITLAKAYNDLFGLEYCINYMRLSLSIKGKMHDDLIKLLQGATPKISVPTSLQKVRRIFSNRGGKDIQEETDEAED